MLKIFWHEPDLEGYTDLIPGEWLIKGAHITDGAHDFLDPKGDRLIARCSVSSIRNATILNYSGKHRRLNQDNEIYLGAMKIVFTDDARKAVERIEWKSEDRKVFESCDATFDLTSPIHTAAGKLTREAILKAIQECDHLGRKQFLSKYGFRGAKDYFLSFNGKNYDSKAIVAVAHKFVGERKPLRWSELSGGKDHAAKLLRSLDFIVNAPGENADWSWDEHILALQLYMRHRENPLGKSSAPIAELSALLNHLGERTGVARTPKFRNTNGVYMKLMNFRRFDPEYAARGRSGLPQGSSLEGRVWQKYSNDADALEETANAIRAAITDETVSLDGITADEDGGEEGSIILRLHKSRERDPSLGKRKKDQILKEKKRLACEVCDFDFNVFYGQRGLGYIEAHHKSQLATLTRAQKTKLSDLALVCANCHRMLHRKGLISIEELKALRAAMQS